MRTCGVTLALVVLGAWTAGCGRDLYDLLDGSTDAAGSEDGGPRSDASIDAAIDAAPLPDAAIDAQGDGGCFVGGVVLADGRCALPLALDVILRPGARTASLGVLTNGDADLGVVVSSSDLGALDASAIRALPPTTTATTMATVRQNVIVATTPATTAYAYVVAYRRLADGSEERVAWTGNIVAEALVRVRTFMDGTIPTESLVFLPDAYFHDPGVARPTILFLHGWGGATAVPDAMGLAMDDGLLERIVSEPGRYTAFPFVVVAPHCIEAVHGGCWGWVNDSVALAALTDAAAAFPVDARRTYVTGLSTGGEGTFTLASNYPTRFAAAVPIASTFDAATPVCNMSDVPVWAFHGDADTLQPPRNSQMYVDRIATGCPTAPVEAPTLTLVPCRTGDPNHCGWIEAYDGTHPGSAGGFTSIFDWMLSHTR